MSFELVVREGPDKGRRFPIDDGDTLTVGRGTDSDTRLDDATVSRVHCEVARHGFTVTLRDLNSSGGTLVGGRPIERIELRPGTTFRIGASTLELSHPGMASDSTYIGQPVKRQPPVRELVGSSMGPYRIDEIIGEGVSGVVFKAHDTEKNRVAAVKILTPTYSRSEEQRQRFVRAMKTMLPIRDPHIVRLYQAGISGGYCWAAMEYIDGENLAQLIERLGIEGMLDWQKVWRVARDVAQALQTGFEHKVVHRNLTPTNILRRASDDTCLLGDFMLAKALEGKLAQQLTQVGQIVGEVAYMAPERAEPSGQVDTRSDMYGLGATCYALLTGRPPVVGKSFPELIANLRKVVPQPPKHFQLSVNDMFQDVIMRTLEKQPADRFENPSQLLTALNRIGKFNNLRAN